jgi:hypothetical protein
MPPPNSHAFSIRKRLPRRSSIFLPSIFLPSIFLPAVVQNGPRLSGARRVRRSNCGLVNTPARYSERLGKTSRPNLVAVPHSKPLSVFEHLADWGTPARRIRQKDQRGRYPELRVKIRKSGIRGTERIPPRRGARAAPLNFEVYQGIWKTILAGNPFSRHSCESKEERRVVFGGGKHQPGTGFRLRTSSRTEVISQRMRPGAAAVPKNERNREPRRRRRPRFQQPLDHDYQLRCTGFGDSALQWLHSLKQLSLKIRFALSHNPDPAEL